MGGIRNEKIDIIRGIAVILVLAGHTLQIYDGCADNIVFNIIQSILMMVSGYATGYSRPLCTWQDLLKFIRKRTVALLLPWGTCSLLVFGVISDYTLIEHIKFILYHMESAFWFLFSLWSISVVFSVASFISYKISGAVMLRETIFRITITLIFNALLFLFGTKIGLTFLGTKYTTYYMVFFLVGWLWHLFEDRYPQWTSWKLSQTLYFLLVVFYSIFISKYKIVEMSDNSLFWISVRCLISMAGCIIIIYPVYKYLIPLKLKNVVLHFGNNSLEYYIIQYFWINLFVMPFTFSITTTEGLANWFVYFILMCLLCFITIKTLSATPLTRFVFFGKK